MSDNATKRSSRTDWTRVDAQRDEQIDTLDVPPLDPAWFERAHVRRPDGMIEFRVQVEPAVFAWFSKQGDDWGRMATAALAIYAEAHRSAGLNAGDSVNRPAEPADTRSMLERRFGEALMDVFRRAKTEAKYHATQFHQMLIDHGGLETARILLHKNEVSTGYTALWERGRLDLTLEAVIFENPEWHPLFTADEIGIARDRLAQYKYEPATRASA